MIEQWSAQIKEAAVRGRRLRIRGGGSKDHLGERVDGDLFSTREHAGIVDYEPRELVITARCGTPLADVEDTMAAAGQMLAFEAPQFGPYTTIGGVVASGLSGPRRPFVGAVRDFVLGVSIIDGKGDALAFGGKVMKNVAGFDVSRLMTGAWGTLGVITEVSFKCLPLPKVETTLRFECDAVTAIEHMNGWAGRPLPISGACWVDGVMRVRLSGAAGAVDSAKSKMGGESRDETAFWTALRDQRLPFFIAEESARSDPLWRLSVKSTAPLLHVPAAQNHSQLIDWGGAQRFLRAPALEVAALRSLATSFGGHASLLSDKSYGIARAQAIPDALVKIHQQLKATFDPYGIFNVGRLHSGF